MVLPSQKQARSRRPYDGGLLAAIGALAEKALGRRVAARRAFERAALCRVLLRRRAFLRPALGVVLERASLDRIVLPRGLFRLGRALL
jgi:hypothetical protein